MHSIEHRHPCRAEQRETKDLSQEQTQKTKHRKLGPMRKEMKVTLGDIERFGFTDMGCARCDFTKENGHANGCGHPHSPICRSRIKKELSATEDGRARLQAFDERRKRSSQKKEEELKPTEARAAEELMKEGMPAALRAGEEDEDEGTKTPVAGNDDEEMSHSGDEAMDEEGESAADEDKNGEDEDTEMTLLDEESPLERFLQLSKDISEDTAGSRLTNHLDKRAILNLGNENIYIYIRQHHHGATGGRQAEDSRGCYTISGRSREIGSES